MRLSLIKSRVRDTTGATNWWVTTNIIGSKKASALPYYMQSWDSEKCKVLRSVTKRATYDATLAADGYIEMYVPINQKIRYDADNSGYGRFTNHYWVIEYFQQGQGALSTAPLLSIVNSLFILKTSSTLYSFQLAPRLWGLGVAAL